MKLDVVNAKSSLTIWIACLIVSACSNSFGQFLPDPILLDSFEGTAGISDWSPQNDYTPVEGGTYISQSQSTIGATAGSSSLALELGNGFGYGVTLTAGSGDADLSLYNAFNTVAQDPSAWYLEGDLTFDASSWANVSPPAVPPFQGRFGFLVAVNDDDGFSYVPAGGDVFGEEKQVHLRLRMADLAPAADSSFFQITLGANAIYQTGGTAEDPLGAIAYVDNLRFTPVPPTVPVTLFSWETPSGGNGEEFEGWSDCGLGCMADPPSGHTGTHIHTVVDNSPAATDGTHILRIDNTRQNDPNLVPNGFAFYWGSTYELNSNTAPEGEDPVIDPEIQAQIDSLRETFNSASAIAFDVHFEDLFNGFAYDPFSPAPSFVRFAVALNDGTGTWWQAEGVALSGTPDVNADDTFEYVIGTDTMEDANNTVPGYFNEAGLEESNSLGIIFAVNADGGLLADIDNFRVFVEVDLSADFDNDGDVDSDDLTVLQASYGIDDGADADGDGDTDGQDYLIWQETFGNDATQSVVAFSAQDLALLGLSPAAVPEPTTTLMLSLAVVVVGMRRGVRRMNAY